MKKLLSASLLAVLVALVTSRPADAWINAKFSVGLNWSLQSGNNTILWGLYRNGQLPENGDYGYYQNAPAVTPAQQQFQWFGNAPKSMPAATAQNATQPGYTGTAYSGYTNPYYTTTYQPSYNYAADPYTWYYQP